MKLVWSNYLTRPIAELSDLEVDQLRDALASELADRRMWVRSHSEYVDARHNAKEDLPTLTRVLLANGRQFVLSKAQRQVVESMVGEILTPEVTIYGVVWSTSREYVTQFAMQCNAERVRRHSSQKVSSVVIHDAEEFFRKAAERQGMLDMEEPTEAKPSKPCGVKKPTKKQQSAEELLKSLGLL